MTWVTFDSIVAFNDWHDRIKVELGIPSSAVDAAGNQVAGQETTAYTQPHIVSESDIRADVESTYLDGLKLSENPNVQQIRESI